MRAIVLTVILLTGCASTGGRVAGGVAIGSGLVAGGALISSVCIAPTTNNPCDSSTPHEVMLGSVLVGVAALAVMIGFEINHATAQHAQTNVQY
jgi:hypothetical protein